MTRRRLALVAVLLLAIGAVACQPRLGSSTNGFGNQLAGDLDGDGVIEAGDCVDPEAACAGAQPRMWAAINSPTYAHAQGDPYSVTCLSGSTCGWNPATPNPEWRTTGYTYGVEVAEAGQTVTVEIYDAPVNSTSTRTGDAGSFPVQYELFTDDGDGLTISTDPALSLADQCATGPGRRGFPGAYQPTTYKNRWWTLCTFTAPVAGVYPLQVRVADLTDDPSTGITACTPNCTKTTGGTGTTSVTAGMNAYAVRATATTGAAPRTFAVGDMSIYTPTSAGTSTQQLIEVPAARAGDQLTVDLFDVGDTNASTATIELNGPAGFDVRCTLTYGAIGGARIDPPEGTESYPTECRAPTRAASASRFNDRWVKLTVTVPPTYTCTADCWWTLTWANNATATDRVTITAAITEPT